MKKTGVPPCLSDLELKIPNNFNESHYGNVGNSILTCYIYHGISQISHPFMVKKGDGDAAT